MSLIVLASLLFGVGLYGVMVRRDVIGVLIAIEVMMGAAMVLLVGMGGGVSRGAAERAAQLAHTQSVGLLVLVVAAAEAAVGLALLVSVARRSQVTRIDEMTEGKG